jgi:hypothetical protein
LSRAWQRCVLVQARLVVRLPLCEVCPQALPPLPVHLSSSRSMRRGILCLLALAATHAGWQLHGAISLHQAQRSSLACLQQVCCRDPRSLEGKGLRLCLRPRGLLLCA